MTSLKIVFLLLVPVALAQFLQPDPVDFIKDMDMTREQFEQLLRELDRHLIATQKSVAERALVVDQLTSNSNSRSTTQEVLADLPGIQVLRQVIAAIANLVRQFGSVTNEFRTMINSSSGFLRAFGRRR